jgi:small subunit ribosomal protein S10e
MVAKESAFAPKHMELDVPNLHVLKEMKSLKSRGYITQQFNWGYYYWYLTNDGIEFLRG